MSTIIESIEKEQLRSVPRFEAGDRVRVHFRVVEGTRTRTQVFEGVAIKRQGSGARETFTVRKQSFGVGVERTFPLHSPKIEQLEVAARGDVRRAKLYYLRDRVGKAARVAERRWGITEEVLDTNEDEGALDQEGTAQEHAEVEVVEPAEEDPQGDAEADAGADAEGEPVEPADAEPVAAEEAAPTESAESTDEEASTADAGAGGEGSAAEDDQAGGSEGDTTENEASERDS